MEQAIGFRLRDTLFGRTDQSAYRHVIDWLVRKPGAFENYGYKCACQA